VFGEASKFLLPWKRVFKVTESQVDVAIRDNATRLFNVQLSKVDKGKLLQRFTRTIGILLFLCNANLSEDHMLCISRSLWKTM
jgi:hypothetical protein